MQFIIDSTIVKQTSLQVQNKLQKYKLATTGSKSDKKCRLQEFLSRNNILGLLFKLFEYNFIILL